MSVKIVGGGGVEATTAALETAIAATTAAVAAVEADVVLSTTETTSVATAVAALGYEFTINGVNFNGYAKIKTLTLDTGAYNDHPQTFHDEGADYEVDTGKVFIAFQVLAWNQQTAMVGRIGESDAADGVITKEVLKLANGTLLPFMTPCYGVFAAGKFITAESDSGSSNYCLKSGTVLYGVEVDA